MHQQIAIAQALKYADELRAVHASERRHRHRAEEALADLNESYAATVRALAAALELRDDETGGHAERVTQLALRLAERVAPELAREPELEYGFLLHDIGKIGIPDSILLKPGPLDASELALIREHPCLGQRIVARVPHLRNLAEQVVYAHHERWDGAGYPDGLSGTDIPLGARLFALADSFDAMTTDRPYRRALPVQVALEQIEREAGRQFEPRLVDEFLPLVAEAASVV